MDQYQRYMLARPGTVGAGPRDEALNAIREIGTNALPTLLQMVAAKDSPLKKKFASLAARQSLVQLQFHSADYYHAKASYGFGALGPIAKPAVPSLIPLLQSRDPQVQTSAAHSLSLIGPDAESAVPALLPLLEERNDGLAILESMLALGHIHKQPELVLPRLVEFLNEPKKDWNYAGPALEAIGWYQAEAKHLVPLIEPFMDDPSSNIRDSALNALNRIDMDASIRARKARAGKR